MSLATNDRAGAALLGTFLLGGASSVGTARFTRASTLPFGGAQVGVSVTSRVPESVSAVVFLDGEPLARRETPGDGSETLVGITTLAPGSHTVAARLFQNRFATVPDMGGMDFGAAVVTLRWGRATASDLAGYVVEWDAGTDGVTWATLATVTDIRASHVVAALPTGGTGTGRATTSGNWGGSPMNALWRVKIASATTFQVDPGTGTYATARTIVFGAPMPIGDGLAVTFESAAALYATNDYWEVWVGPRARYLTGPLAADTYQFRVSSIDASGNQSSPSTAASVLVNPWPDAPTGLTLAFNSGTRVVTATATGTDGGATYELFTNWSRDFNELTDSIIFDCPVATRSGPGALTLTLTTGYPYGEYLFVCRRRVSGRSSKNFDATAMVLPTAEGAIAPPFDVRAYPAAGGTIRATWRQDVRTGFTRPEYFAVFIYDSDAEGATAVAVISPVAAPSSTTVGTYAMEATTEDTFSGTHYVRVSAVTAANGATAPWSNGPASVIPDAAAPSAPTALQGGPG